MAGSLRSLCGGAWLILCASLSGAWGEENYSKLSNLQNRPVVPVPFEKIMPWYDHHNHDGSIESENTEVLRSKRQVNSNHENKRTLQEIKNVCAKEQDESRRFDCFIGANEVNCVQRGCCWSPIANTGPWCFYPPQHDTFRFLNMTEDKKGITVYYEKQRPSGYPGDFEMARLDVIYLSNDVVQIKISDALNKRFETPLPEIPAPQPITNPKYRVEIDSALIGFRVIRNADNITVVNTQNVGGTILSDKFLEITTLLPTDRVYGLGEKNTRFLNPGSTVSLFNRDEVPIENQGGYGTHPFYLALEPDGYSHGMVLLNTNAMDILMTSAPALTYRTTGGILNFIVMMGPTPKEVVAQYTEIVGRPFMPPYWSLGFHLCKYSYGGINGSRNVWKSNRDAGVPFDVQWHDIDYMNEYNGFTYDPANYAGLPAFVDELHREGMHHILNINPGVSGSEKRGQYPPYDRGLQLDIFIKDSNNQPFLGKVWNKVSTAFPDFTHPRSSDYWLEMMTLLHKQVPYDGVWLDMNEPANLVSGQLNGQCADEGLPYTPRAARAEGLRRKTLCMDAKHFAGSHYDWHNLYALTESIATYSALTRIRSKRPFIISRSSFVGLGRYAGHWSGDNLSSWRDMRESIPAMLSFSLFGIPMMGVDICGFRGDTSVELCKRWMQLGAFYPFSRNHNSDASKPQDPVSLGEEVVSASRRALRLRYRLLPYYYTLFWRAHVYGETVARPLFFEMPTTTHTIDDQFLIGAHVMVTPILKQGAQFATPFFPGPERWYNILDGNFIQVDRRRLVNENETVSVRGGGIIPMQEPPVNGPVTTTVSRRMPFQLLVVPNTIGAARGELYWDDGDSLNSYEDKKYGHIEFSLGHQTIQSTVNWRGFEVPHLNNITVLAQSSPVISITINDLPCRKPICEFTYLPETQVLQIFNMDISLDNPFNVKWTDEATEPLKESEQQASQVAVTEDSKNSLNAHLNKDKSQIYIHTSIELPPLTTFMNSTINLSQVFNF